MLRFGFPEVACRNDFRNDFPRPQARSIDVGDGVFGNPLLLDAGIEDCRSVASPDVVALAIAGGRVVNLEEEFEELPIADPDRIKNYFHGFRVSRMIAIRRMPGWIDLRDSPEYEK